jgi:pimeloyl-ACP methyl ester carboxylesterase
MDDTTLRGILATKPPSHPAYRPGLDPAMAGARIRIGEPFRGARRSSSAPIAATLLVVAGALVLALFVSLLPRSAPPIASPSAASSVAATDLPSVPPTTAAPDRRRLVVPPDDGGARMDLVYDLPPGVLAGIRNSYFGEIGWPDGPYLSVWWRVGSVNGNPCLESGDRGWDPSRVVRDPTPSETYELLRTARVFEATEEAPFAFAGTTGRSVVLTLDPRRGALCVAAGRPDSIMLTSADRGYQAGHIVFPTTGAMRLATAEVAERELLIAIVGASVADLDTVSELIDSFDVEPVPAPTARAETPPFAGRVDIGDRSLYLTCRGTGRPTIILMNGAGNDTTSWSGIVDELVGISRVCAYDRANTGRSDAAPTPRSMADGADEVVALMAAAGIEPPVVLVGHSMGGLAARMAAVAYPDAVVGIVLVDVPSADFFPDRGCARLSETACELLGSLMGPNGEGFNPTAEDLAAIRTKVLEIPVHVLAATHHDVGEPGEDEIEALHASMQAELAASMPDGVLVVAEGSGHYIQDDRPELVVEAVDAVVRAARSDRP